MVTAEKVKYKKLYFKPRFKYKKLYLKDNKGDEMANKAIVNLDTGEIVTKLEEGDRVVRNSSRELLNTTYKIVTKNFVKINVDEVMALLPTLSKSEGSVFLNLIPYISYRTCCLQYSNGREVNLDTIVSITGMSKPTVIGAVEGLISKDVLYKGRNSKSNQYFVNPWIANKGMIANKVLQQMFRNYRVKSLNNIKWGDMEMITRL